MQKLKNPIFAFLFVSILFTSCNGQTKQTDNKSEEQLSFTSKKPKLSKTQGSNEFQDISCGLQDKAGNLWFGSSAEGVYNYDGKLFTQFTIQNGLSSNAVRTMLEDKKGNIWIGTDKGLCCYDGKTIKQISMPNNLANSSNYSASINASLSSGITSMMEDKKGKLWIGTSEGVLCYDADNFSRFSDNYAIRNDSNLTLKSVQCMFEDKKGNIWFGSGPLAFEGLCLFDGISLRKFNPKKQLWIRKISEGENDTLLFVTRGAGVVKYDGTDFSSIPKPEKLINNLLTYFFTDQKGSRWYASDYLNSSEITTGGLWRFDNKSFTEFTKKDGLSNTSVTFILEDKNANIWLGTRNNGLYRYKGQTFETFSE